MTSPWQAAWAQRGGAFDVVYGERIEVRPVAAGQFLSPANDPDHPAFDAIGILDLMGEILQPSGGVTTGARSEIVRLAPQVDFALSQFGDGRPKPVEGTVLTALDRPGAPRLRVMAALPSDDGHVVYEVALL